MTAPSISGTRNSMELAWFGEREGLGAAGKAGGTLDSLLTIVLVFSVGK